MAPLQAALVAMVLPDTTQAEIAEIGQMVEEGDLPDSSDEDSGPINEEAAARLRAWILERALASARSRAPRL